ncbi:N-acetylmuramoyl-L-alanine amidase [Streptomyces griseorubiginosus]|uniref:N-acetylmuramoyl-L-alanine amidase n=1 Tax=Streptomyces griseorubiginosus TaxID=67304 RepID=UPI00076BFE0A|nr:N-acetylmuramoyl-L-alanine amidase [Streptomyces griseorubiginosus]KUM77564.1 N-acetylmuramoyl-L-alanine amidase [Streptomyces griseorubiginosus]
MKRRAWLTLGAVVLGGGGIAGYAVASPSTDGAGSPAERPVKVYNLGLKAPETGERELPRTETKQFSLLGISWTGATKKLDGKAQVRTRSVDTGTWSSWQDLETDADPVEDADERAGARGASEPLWVGPSDGVEVQVVHEDGTTSAGLPSGLKVNLVDPGVTAAEADAATEPAAYAEDVTPSPSAPSPTATTPAGPASNVPEPPIVSRAGWGADEKLSPDPSEYNADVKAVFVHHTAGSNDYTCAESASIVRAIYAYHTAPAPNGNGWNDLGYNFLVDKCGTIFEGRKGGVDQPVLGAHTYGWNRESAGIAVIGEYTAAGASNAALTSVARIAAWKLGQYGVDPASTVQLKAGATQKNLAGTSFTSGTSYPFSAISGHRDGYATECPGNSLYGQLPTIRAWAAGPVQGLKVTSLTGATLSGSTYWTKGAITVKWSTTTPGSLISKFELLVDGNVVTTVPGTATSANTTLAAGSHKVAVRAVHQSGKTDEKSTTTALTVVADTTAPVFATTPKLTLRTGTVETAAVPVTLGWKATDAQALKQVNLTSPTTATFGPTITSSNRTAKSGAASTWSMTAYDVAGNTRTSSPAFTPLILQETSATKSGSWTSRSSSSYLGGKSYSSGTKNASLTWTFTGRSAAWVVSRASTSGQAYVYVDGTKVATVDLKSSTTKYRQAIWTKSWSSSAQHKIKIVVVGTSGRPTITTDGLVYVK